MFNDIHDIFNVLSLISAPSFKCTIKLHHQLLSIDPSICTCNVLIYNSNFHCAFNIISEDIKVQLINIYAYFYYIALYYKCIYIYFLKLYDHLCFCKKLF